MQAQREVKSFTEHQGRVWSVINLKDTLFASSADDKTIKIWDSRKEHSIFTLKGNPGRVSSMLRIDENTFISGSCPDNIEDSSEKACIRFWDMRRL
jgi:WD40 repeat protein